MIHLSENIWHLPPSCKMPVYEYRSIYGTYAACVQVAHGVAWSPCPAIATDAPAHELKLPFPLPGLRLREVSERFSLEYAVLHGQRLSVLHHQPDIEGCARLALDRSRALQLLKPQHEQPEAPTAVLLPDGLEESPFIHAKKLPPLLQGQLLPELEELGISLERSRKLGRVTGEAARAPRHVACHRETQQQRRR